MSEKLEAAMNSLSEQNKKMNIAMHYTHGDAEKAKEMVSGTYNDVYALKVKFTSTSASGAFLFFFNIPYMQVLNSFVIVVNSYSMQEINTAADWKDFETAIQEHLDKGDYDAILRPQLKDALGNYFSIQMEREHKATELKTTIEKGDSISINHIFHKFLQDRLGFQNISATADHERISSLDMELFSKSSRKLDLVEKANEEKEKKKKQVDETVEEENPLKGKVVKLILEGNFILSPIKGKEISKLREGDRIKVSLSARNPKAIHVAKAFNAYDGEKILPIIGRVVNVKHISPGYEVYLIIAKGIYVKIDEEEETIKVSMDPSVTKEQQEKEAAAAGRGNTVIIILIIVLLMIISLIVFFASS